MLLLAKKVQTVAAKVAADSPYRFGSKVLISRVASHLGMSVRQLAPTLLLWHRSGEIELARVDMVAGMSLPGALKRSMIRAPGMPDTSGWHAIVAPPKSSR